MHRAVQNGEAQLVAVHVGATNLAAEERIFFSDDVQICAQRSIVDGVDGDVDGGGAGSAVGVGDGVGEAVGAIVIGRRRVKHALAVATDGHAAVARRAHGGDGHGLVLIGRAGVVVAQHGNRIV